ncbi:hypothetical protein [Citrobacter freundii]|uniref:hypothetical protein n=1 Tax=Citrobacter freundii TaxID=546 RepID=UPI00367219DF|nr:hypothetical protein [Citrobacter freundii]
MNKYRVLCNCLDRAGIPLPVTWNGNAISPGDAIQKMKHEAQGNGWSVGEIICVQQWKISQGMEATA